MVGEYLNSLTSYSGQNKNTYIGAVNPPLQKVDLVIGLIWPVVAL
jgi:hypothetical protein